MKKTSLGTPRKALRLCQFHRRQVGGGGWQKEILVMLGSITKYALEEPRPSKIITDGSSPDGTNRNYRCTVEFPRIENFRRPHSSYQTVVQGKCPLNFLNLNGIVCSNTLFSNTSALTSSLLFRGNSTCKILEHLVWSNTSGFQFWGPLARKNFLSALCGLPKIRIADTDSSVLEAKRSSSELQKTSPAN